MNDAMKMITSARAHTLTFAFATQYIYGLSFIDDEFSILILSFGICRQIFSERFIGGYVSVEFACTLMCTVYMDTVQCSMFTSDHITAIIVSLDLCSIFFSLAACRKIECVNENVLWCTKRTIK